MLFCSMVTPLKVAGLTVLRMGCRNVAGTVVHVGYGRSRTPWWMWDLHTQEKIDDDSEVWGFLSQVAVSTTFFIWHADREMASGEALESKKCETSLQWCNWGGGIKHQKCTGDNGGGPTSGTNQSIGATRLAEMVLPALVSHSKLTYPTHKQLGSMTAWQWCACL